MRSSTLLLIGYVAVVIGCPITYPKYKQINCTEQDGNQQCVEATFCRSTAIQLAFGQKPVICGWRENVPLVCCSKTSGETAEEIVEIPDVKWSWSWISSRQCGVRIEPTEDISDKGDSSGFRLSLGSNIATTPEPESGIFVVGGEKSAAKWPWMVAIFSGSRTRQLCGGTLIDDQHVLTAAHCFAENSLDPKDYTVMIGELSLASDYERLKVEAIKLHEDYDSRYYYNDIAIIRLEPVYITANPACVPTEGELRPGDTFMLLGWGDLAFGGRSSLELQEVAGLPLIDNSYCDRQYRSLTSRAFPRGITDTFLCAGLDEGGKDACQGDSGGPLLYQHPESKVWIAVGIVSFGYGCGDAGYPGVYTRISSYTKWIENYIEEKNRAAYTGPIFVRLPVKNDTQTNGMSSIFVI